jgi:hypothetical protein
LILFSRPDKWHRQAIAKMSNITSFIAYRQYDSKLPITTTNDVNKIPCSFCCKIASRRLTSCLFWGIFFHEITLLYPKLPAWHYDSYWQIQYRSL